MEMQRGVVGDLSPLAPLVQAAEDIGLIDHLALLMSHARQAGVQVVYGNAKHRADRKGSAANCPMLVRSPRANGMVESTPDVDIVQPLAARSDDIVIDRYHSLSPFTGTALDVTLGNLGIRTIVATGVSLNVAIIAMCAEAVGLGHNVVVPSDCVVGVPRTYGDDVLRYTLPVLATVLPSASLSALWAR